MKLQELRYAVNSFSAADLVLESVAVKHPYIDIGYHTKRTEKYFIVAVTSKKQRTRKKYRRKLVNYYGEIKKAIKINLLLKEV